MNGLKDIRPHVVPCFDEPARRGSAPHANSGGSISGMDVILNGEPATLPAPLTIAGLLAHLDIDARRVAVELNEAVIKRAFYDQTPINQGDAVEIVNFVGGG